MDGDVYVVDSGSDFDEDLYDMDWYDDEPVSVAALLPIYDVTTSTADPRDSDPDYETLNVREEGAEYHERVFEYDMFSKHPRQRGRLWTLGRMNPVSASRCPTILYHNYYSENEAVAACDSIGMDWRVFNRNKLFLQQTGRMKREPLKNTGNLTVDHIRRGVLLEDPSMQLHGIAMRDSPEGYEPLLESPSVRHPFAGFIYASADRILGTTWRNVEGKSPVTIKYMPKPARTRLARFNMETGYALRVGDIKLRPWLETRYPSPCISHQNVPDICYKAKPIQVVSMDEQVFISDPTIYPDQIQCQRVVLRTFGSRFVQFDTEAYLRRFHHPLEGESDADCVKRTMRDIIPKVTPDEAATFNFVTNVPPEDEWLSENYHELWRFFAQVMEYREKHGLNPDRLAELMGYLPEPVPITYLPE